MGVAHDPDSDISLDAPVRTQLVELAADVLGRLPAEKVPAGSAR